jgi:two-component system cell cycle response regulator
VRVLAPGTPVLARVLLAITVAAFAAVILDYGFDVVPPVPSDIWANLYNFTEFVGFAACALRVAYTSGAERAAWAALSIGLLGFIGADLYYTVALADLESPPYPSWADVGYLSIYPAAYVALVLLLRSRAGRISPSLWLDGVVCALAAAALGAALVLGVVASTEGSPATVVTNLSYPLGDLALLSFVVAVIIVAGWRAGRTWLLIAVGFGIFAVADTIYLYQTAIGTYDEGRLLDAGWPAMYVLAAFAAWQPRKRLDARRLRNGGMLALPAGAALLSVAILVYDHYTRLHPLAVWLASGALAVIVARLALVFRENLAMLRASEREATTDALTGLGNRRALIADVERLTADDEHEHDAHYALALFDLDGFKGYNDAFGHPAGDALLERLGRNLRTAIEGAGTAYRMGGDEFCVLASAADVDIDALMERAAAALSEQGRRFRVGCSYGVVVIEPGGSDPVEALRLADQRMYEHKRGGRRSTAESVHQVLLSVVGEHDGALRDHVDGVTMLAEQVGRRLGLADDELAQVRRAAALHDIGKVAIPDAILHAPRALTEDEWEYMRQHTIIGGRIISVAPELEPVAQMVRSSHERFDGGGYPDGLAGEDIPLGARIVSVCDSFEAMTATRAYRAAMPVEEALEELQRCSGTQFDPRVVEAFIAVMHEQPQEDLEVLAA